MTILQHSNTTILLFSLTRETQLYQLPNNHQANCIKKMPSNSLNYPLLAIPAYYVFSLIPHGYAGSLLSSNGYKVNNANPKASLSPDAVKGKVPDAMYVVIFPSTPNVLYHFTYEHEKRS